MFSIKQRADNSHVIKLVISDYHTLKMEMTPNKYLPFVQGFEITPCRGVSNTILGPPISENLYNTCKRNSLWIRWEKLKQSELNSIRDIFIKMIGNSNLVEQIETYHRLPWLKTTWECTHLKLTKFANYEFCHFMDELHNISDKLEIKTKRKFKPKKKETCKVYRSRREIGLNVTSWETHLQNLQTDVPLNTVLLLESLIGISSICDIIVDYSFGKSLV